METGIRATVGFDGPADCRVAQFAAAADTDITRVSTSVADDGPPVTEFLVDADASVPEWFEAEPVFSYDAAVVYRAVHDGEACPCACLGAHGCPIHRYAADAGGLRLVFHVEDFDGLQSVMASLREHHPDVDVRRLLQPPLEGSAEDRRFVNCGRLTDRQSEVLRTAYRRGYFERPKRANATELAEELGISRSTLTEHLAAAQRKLFEDLFDG